MEARVAIGTLLALGLFGPTIRAEGGGQAVEEVKLLAADGGALDRLGSSVAAHRETVVVGATNETLPGTFEAGAAYVFAAGPGGWVQQAKLVDPFGPTTQSEFGGAVAIEGDTLAVSAYWGFSPHGKTGSVSVFTRGGTTWTLEQAFGSPDAALLGGDLDLEDGVLLVGDVGADGAVAMTGPAFVFERVGGVWTQTGKLFKAGGENSDNLGRAVALSGDTALVGDPSDAMGADLVGSATVFVRSGTSWVEGPTLFAPTPQDDAWFGFGLDLEGDWAVIGAWKEDQFGPDAGAAHVFERSGTTWSFRQTVTGAGVAHQEWFGKSRRPEVPFGSLPLTKAAGAGACHERRGLAETPYLFSDGPLGAERLLQRIDRDRARCVPGQIR